MDTAIQVPRPWNKGLIVGQKPRRCQGRFGQSAFGWRCRPRPGTSLCSTLRSTASYEHQTWSDSRLRTSALAGLCATAESSFRKRPVAPFNSRSRRRPGNRSSACWPANHQQIATCSGAVLAGALTSPPGNTLASSTGGSPTSGSTTGGTALTRRTKVAHLYRKTGTQSAPETLPVGETGGAKGKRGGSPGLHKRSPESRGHPCPAPGRSPKPVLT